MDSQDYIALSNKIDTGFEKVFVKIGELKDDYNMHKIMCGTRFSSIEQVQAVKNALDKRTNEETKEKYDWGKWFIRLTLGAIALKTISDVWLRG